MAVPIPTPTLGTKSPGLFKPSGTTTLFRTDLLVVTPGSRVTDGTVMQYSIEDYDGPRSGITPDWKDARIDPATGKWSFALPVGAMRVRVCAYGEAGESAPSKAYSILVKG